MQKIIDFFKTTFLGGVLVVLPAWVAVLLLVKALVHLEVIVKPVSNELPSTVRHPIYIAIGLMILVCFLVGLAIRTTIGNQVKTAVERNILEKVPGYVVIRNVAPPHRRNGPAPVMRCWIRSQPLPRTAFFVAWLVAATVLPAAAQTDPLPSWNDTASKKAIVAFVEKVTKDGSPDFIPIPRRIAVFDNDGTLWPENPIPFQAAFVAYEIKRQLPDHPDWKSDPAVKAFLKGDVAALTAENNKGLIRVIALTHTGMTVDEFNQRVKDWASKDQHPRFKRPYLECVYQPMLEVLTYLRAHGFQTWIVSGGGKDFMSVWTEDVYGIPPEQVIGSSSLTKFEMKDGKPTLTKTLDFVFVDDKAGKPVAIHQYIGRRPVMCFGNSDGDQAMLEYTTIDNPLPSFGLIVHHTDADREYAYDVKPKSSGKLVTALVEAKDRNWTVVDMQTDWKTVLPPAK